MEHLAAITSNQLTQIGIYTLILVLIWLAMRFLFRIAKRIFIFGCGAILVLGLLLILMKFLTPN
jgi:hypothetical protein